MEFRTRFFFFSFLFLFRAPSAVSAADPFTFSHTLIVIEAERLERTNDWLHSGLAPPQSNGDWRIPNGASTQIYSEKWRGNPFWCPPSPSPSPEGIEIVSKFHYDSLLPLYILIINLVNGKLKHLVCTRTRFYRINAAIGIFEPPE